MSGTSPGVLAPARIMLRALILALALAASIPAFTAMQARPLEAEPDTILPIPKNISSLLLTGVGVDNAPYRHELKVSVPASLDSVLAFYRAELARRGWQEASKHAAIKPDQVRLAFSSPDGPAVLKLGTDKGGTTINLVQKIPAAAAKSGVMPKPGQSNLSFINAGQSDATFTINEQTLRIAAGSGGPPAMSSPTLDLPPGGYRYSLKIADGPVQNNEIELTADDNTALIIGASGQITLQPIY